MEPQPYSRSRGRLLDSGWMLAALAMLELTVVGYMAVRCREEIALEWRAVGAVDDDTSDTPTSASTLLRLLQCVWLPCNFVDVLALAVLRASLLATTAAPARVHSQFYSLGILYTVTAVYLLLKFSRAPLGSPVAASTFAASSVRPSITPLAAAAATVRRCCQVHMLRVTVALSVWCLLVGWVEMVVAHRRLGRLVLQNMYEHWLAAHPHADTMPRVLEWLRRPAGEESDDDDGYEAIEPSSPLGSFTGSFTSALSHANPPSTAVHTTPSPAHAPLQPPPPPPQPESGHTDDGKDDPAAVAKSLEFVTEAVTAAEVAAVVALSERTRAAMLPLPPHDRYFTLLRFVRARDGHVGKAEDMLRAMLRWRQSFGVERLYYEGFDFPEEQAVLKVYPHAYHRTDRLGRPVFIMLLGQIDPVQLERLTTVERLERNHVYEWEKLLAEKFPACSAVAGRRIYNSCTIFDLQGISLYQFHQARHMLQRVTQLDQDYYPEYLGELILVNSPWFFKGIWAAVLPWLGKRTQRKITVLGTDYEAELHKRIHPDSLPHFLGGNCRCDRGGGGCLGQPWEGPWTSRRLSNVSGGHRPVQSPPPA